ncbi:MAG: FAD-dependent oxidoreductase [Sphingomonadales bacterium]
MPGADYDVIVIGGGGGGMSAALVAAATGARVLLVEAGSRCGGATALSGGAFYAAGTRVQQAAGIEGDSAEAMYTYGMALNRYRMEPSVFRRFCEETGGALHWLIDLGVQFPPAGLTLADVSGVPRSHWAVGRGAAIAETLEGHLQSAGVEVVTNTRVRKLTVESGAVTGIEVEGETIHANAVVVASGGFGANDELLAKHYPAAAEVEGSWYIGPETSQGDSLAFGSAVGAALTGENRGLQLMSPGLHPTLEMPPGWLVFVNKHGLRFMNESVPYCVFNPIFEAQPDRMAFAIFDRAAFENPPKDPRFAAAQAAGTSSTDWKTDILAAGLKAGRILEGNTLEDLAARAGIRPGALTETVARYNEGAEAGEDRLFFKGAQHLVPIGAGPYYAATMTMQIVCFTSYGLRIDREARVQDLSGKPIPGLYAAGEASGGLMGEVYLGSGNSIANAVTFGRIAGTNAGRYARSNFAGA